MPLIKSNYEPTSPWGHLQTILPNLFRKVNFIAPEEITIDTDDGDFLELDHYRHSDSNDKAVILSHGLEGNSKRVYMRGMAKFFYERGYDVIAWNYRSCGKTMNKLLRFYHSGETEDIHRIIQYASNYEKLGLIGFSLGGNMTLKYLGEQGKNISPNIKAACAISAPIDLKGSSMRMARVENRIYMNRFIKKMRAKLEKKRDLFPPHISLDKFDEVKSFVEFDQRYTAPIHGFDSAEDYWRKASSLYYIADIAIPTLTLNARNDSFLNRTCYPYEIATNSEYFFLEVPNSGGHLGFWKFEKTTWCEHRAFSFIDPYISDIPTS